MSKDFCIPGDGGRIADRMILKHLIMLLQTMLMIPNGSRNFAESHDSDSSDTYSIRRRRQCSEFSVDKFLSPFPLLSCWVRIHSTWKAILDLREDEKV